MIVKVKKILIYGIRKEILKIFKRIQKEEIIEFITPDKMKKLPSFLIKYLKAIKILKKEIPIKKIKVQYREDICDNILEVAEDIKFLENRKKELLEEKKKAFPFGKFSKNDLEYIKNEGKKIFQFFCKKTSKKEKVPQDLIYINTEYDLDYFISIGTEKKEYKGFIELEFEHTWDVFEKEVQNIDERIKNRQKELRSFASYLEDLQEDFINKLNIYNLEKAKNSSKIDLEDMFFSIEGWVEVSKLGTLSHLLEDSNVHYEEISLDKEEIPPTVMRNNDFVKMGEDLVNIYDVPSQKDKDPSFWVLAFFTLFFAMIISDAGYGIIYLLIGLFLKYKIKKKTASFKRFINLVFVLSVSCIIWGVATASFFGIEMKPTNTLEKASLLHYLSLKKADYHLKMKDDVYEKWVREYPQIEKAQNGRQWIIEAVKKKNSKEVFEAKEEFSRNILMELSILIGIFHIITSFTRNIRNQISSIGWIIFMIGGYLFFPSLLNATSMVNFLQIISKKSAVFYGKPICFLGIFLAVVLALLQKKGAGIKEVTKIIGVFGDVLSYLRLYALGIAGMILSKTFNDIGVSLGIFGVLVFIVGHGINIVLGVIGGVIHGLRLNFLEWYNHCFYGGGKLFNPLKLLKRR